ncbi:Retroelement [Phytophthora megakarya]|uniref:Retroelement n=1 Tax=Phytophthora megakarya TaxID=4795 RepID=A0A225WJ54_9STRA|nr:Retroelement [Phytophthora megakarya]
MEKCSDSLLYRFIVIWIDDILLFAYDIETYLDKLEEFFDLVAASGLKLSAKKSGLYQQTVKWCGRVISSDGISRDPARIDVLRSMPYPTTAGELQQFLCAANWMRETIPDYARSVDPLQQRLDATLSKGKRTKRVAVASRST